MRIDLQHRGYRKETFSFQVQLLDYALDHLIEDAGNAHRVYELLAIRRPGDIWKYIWLHIFDIPERIWESYRRARKYSQKFPRCPWPKNAIPLEDFDGFFSWCG